MITLTNYLTSSSLNRLIQWRIQYVIDIAAEICADDCSPVSYDVHDEDGCVVIGVLNTNNYLLYKSSMAAK